MPILYTRWNMVHNIESLRTRQSHYITSIHSSIAPIDIVAAPPHSVCPPSPTIVRVAIAALMIIRRAAAVVVGVRSGHLVESDTAASFKTGEGCVLRWSPALRASSILGLID